MSDKKDKNLDFEVSKTIEELEEFDIVDLSDSEIEQSKKLDADALDIQLDDAGESVETISEDVSDDVSIDDDDDFDDVDEMLAAVGGADRATGSTGIGKVAVWGVLGLLVAGAGGYYFLSSGTTSPTVAANPVVAQVAAVQTQVDSSGALSIDSSDLLPAELSSGIADEVSGTMASGNDDAFLGELPQPNPLGVEDVVLVDGAASDDSVSILDIETATGGGDNSGELLDVLGEEENGGVTAQIDAGSDARDAFVEMENDAVSEVEAEAEMVKALGVTPSVDPADVGVVEEVVVESPVSAPAPFSLPVSERVEPSASDAPVVSPTSQVQISDPQEQVDVYFDSIQRVTQQSASLQSSGPVEVDPLVEPASKYLIVTDMKPSNSIEAEVQQAKRALKLGRYDAAYSYYERLYNKSPRDEAILMGRAVSLQKLGRTNAAVSAYEELLAKHPRNPDALVNMLGLVKSQYPAVALQKLLSIRQDFPENAGVLAQIGTTYASMSNYGDAKRYMNMAIGVEPNNALHSYNLAVVYDREGQHKKAIEYYDQALRVDAVHGGGRSVNRDAIYDRLSKLR